jgi:hypothetical protein
MRFLLSMAGNVMGLCGHNREGALLARMNRPVVPEIKSSPQSRQTEWEKVASQGGTFVNNRYRYAALYCERNGKTRYKNVHELNERHSLKGVQEEMKCITLETSQICMHEREGTVSFL